MPGLPKKYAKMGFKRGWKAYNKLKIRSKTKRGVSTMARKRRGGFRRSIKRTYRRAKSGFFMGNITKILIGAGLAAVYEIYISPMVPFDGLIKNIVELGVGIALASMGGMPSYVRAFGGALAIINAYSIIASYLPAASGSGSGSTSNW
jgi:hypothetical protein